MLIICLLLFAIAPNPTASLPPVIRLGAIFESEFRDSPAELAFKYVVFRINADRGLLRGKDERGVERQTQIDYDIQYVDSDGGADVHRKACRLIQSGIVAFLGPRTEKIAAYVKSISRAYDIPYLETRWDNSNPPGATPDADLDATDDPFSIQIQPDIASMNKAFLDLVTYYRWKRFMIVYDTAAGMLKVERAITQMTDPHGSPLTMKIEECGEEDCMRETLRAAKSQSYNNLLIDMPPEKIDKFLHVALQEGMMSDNYSFVVTTIDLETISLTNYQWNKANISAYRLVASEKDLTRELLSELEKMSSEKMSLVVKPGVVATEAAIMFDVIYVLAYALKFLDEAVPLRLQNLSCNSPTTWTYGPSIFNYLESVEIVGLSGDVLFSHGKRKDFKLDLIQVTEMGVARAGSWQSRHGLNVTYKNMGAFRPYVPADSYVTTVAEKNLRVSSNILPPYLVWRPEKEKRPGVPFTGNERFEGYIIDLMEELSKKKNFNYTLELAKDGQYGSELPDGSWNGMVGEVMRGEADLAVGPITITYERASAIDFTKPFLTLGLSIMYKRPISEKPGLFSFMNPFASSLWLWIFLGYIATSLAIFFYGRLTPYEWVSAHPCDDDPDELENCFSIDNTIWMTIGCLMQQGSDIMPRALSTRFVSICYFFFVLIIVSSYTAMLAASLTVENKKTPINNVRDLRNQLNPDNPKHIRFGFKGGGSTETFFADSQIEMYREMWEYINKMKREKGEDLLVKSNEQGFEKAEHENYAYIGESTTLEYNQKNYNLTTYGGLLNNIGFGIGLKKNSPYRDELSLAILEMGKQGILAKLKKSHWEGGPAEAKAGVTALDVENVGGMFLFLFAGTALGGLIGVVEFFYGACKNKGDDETACQRMGDDCRLAASCVTSRKNEPPEAASPSRQCSQCTLEGMNGSGFGSGGAGENHMDFSPASTLRTRRSDRPSPPIDLVGGVTDFSDKTRERGMPGMAEFSSPRSVDYPTRGAQFPSPRNGGDYPTARSVDFPPSRAARPAEYHSTRGDFSTVRSARSARGGVAIPDAASTGNPAASPGTLERRRREREAEREGERQGPERMYEPPMMRFNDFHNHRNELERTLKSFAPPERRT